MLPARSSALVFVGWVVVVGEVVEGMREDVFVFFWDDAAAGQVVGAFVWWVVVGVGDVGGLGGEGV